MAMEREIGRRDNPWSLWVWGAAAALLATPLVAMQLTDEVNWTASDFGIFAVMLGAAGGAWELGMRTLREDGIRKVLSGLTSAEEVIEATMSDVN